MLYRKLGRTGGRPADEPEAIRIVRTGIDRGITFLDNSSCVASAGGAPPRATAPVDTTAGEFGCAASIG